MKVDQAYFADFRRFLALWLRSMSEMAIYRQSGCYIMLGHV